MIDSPTQQLDRSKVTGISPDGTFMRIADGAAQRVMGGLQFHAHGEHGGPFGMFYDVVKVARDSTGEPVWVNSKSKAEFSDHQNTDNWKITGTLFIEVYAGTSTSHVPLRVMRELADKEVR